MHKKELLIAIMMLPLFAMAQGVKFDSTVLYGKVGYRVRCNNKDANNNLASIKLIGFSGARDPEFFVKGVIKQIAIDDFNNDGYPDLMINVYNGPNEQYGNVITLISSENKSISVAGFPDILNDPKLRVGYKGNDHFQIMQGLLMRSYPLYSSNDSTATYTGKKRFIQYQLVKEEGDRMSFKPMHVYEVAAPTMN
ncbi:FG-GAP repeat protein [Hydrotalea sp.]|uniref:FG-GAP repeat protein n=1 Tax=Hydrotalea sp. TaxID=2881279 RepID=UPI003D13FA07